MPKKSAKTTSAKTKSKAKTATAAKPTTTATKQLHSAKYEQAKEPRVIQEPAYRSFRLQKKLPKPETVKLSSSFLLFRRSLGVLGHHWKHFAGITIVIAILNLFLVQGFFSTNVAELKNSVAQGSGASSQLAAGISALGTLVGSAGNDASTSAYRFILLIIGSLAIVWSLRHVLADKTIRIRDAFYEGMYPFVPFILIFLALSLALGPLALAMYLYGLVASTNGVEVLLWAALLVSLTALTLYWLSSGLFALYIVALPGMQPVQALRSAVRLVKYRRFLVIRRILFLPLIITILMALIMLPVIALAPAAASVVFFICIMIMLPIIHSYMYTVYRELLHEKNTQ